MADFTFKHLHFMTTDPQDAPRMASYNGANLGGDATAANFKSAQWWNPQQTANATDAMKAKDQLMDNFPRGVCGESGLIINARDKTGKVTIVTIVPKDDGTIAIAANAAGDDFNPAAQSYVLQGGVETAMTADGT